MWSVRVLFYLFQWPSHCTTTTCIFRNMEQLETATFSFQSTPSYISLCNVFNQSVYKSSIIWSDNCSHFRYTFEFVFDAVSAPCKVYHNVWTSHTFNPSQYLINITDSDSSNFIVYGNCIDISFHFELICVIGCKWNIEYVPLQCLSWPEAP